MAKRWTCPVCGTGRLAPSRMAANDTRRYCLVCSADSPTLVEMVCPSLEREREAKTEQRNARVRRHRKRHKEAKYFLSDGTDIRAILRRVKGLKTIQREEWGMAVLKKLELVMTARVRELAAHDVALDLIDEAATQTVHHLNNTSGRGPKDWSTRLARRRTLALVAACEYFGLEPADVEHRRNVVAALRGKPGRGDDSYRDHIIAAWKAAEEKQHAGTD